MSTTAISAGLRKSTCHLVASLLLILMIGPAREAAASQLVYEGFQYLPGQTLPTMAGGLGWAPGPWIGSAAMIDQAPTLSHPSALPSTGDALFNPQVGEAFRSFSAPLNNGANDLWFSFQEQTAAAGSGSFVDLRIASASVTDLNINKDGLGTITLNALPAGFSAGPVHTDLFVVQIAQFGGGISRVNLFVDPGATLGPPSASFAIPSAVAANQFYFRTDGGQWLDEIRVGTTPLDVLAVPEPATATLLVGALLLGAARRHRSS